MIGSFRSGADQFHPTHIRTIVGHIVESHRAVGGIHFHVFYPIAREILIVLRAQRKLHLVKVFHRHRIACVRIYRVYHARRRVANFCFHFLKTISEGRRTTRSRQHRAYRSHRHIDRVCRRNLSVRHTRESGRKRTEHIALFVHYVAYQEVAVVHGCAGALQGRIHHVVRAYAVGCHLNAPAPVVGSLASGHHVAGLLVLIGRHIR